VSNLWNKYYFESWLVSHSVDARDSPI